MVLWDGSGLGFLMIPCTLRGSFVVGVGFGHLGSFLTSVILRRGQRWSFSSRGLQEFPCPSIGRRCLAFLALHGWKPMEEGRGCKPLQAAAFWRRRFGGAEQSQQDPPCSAAPCQDPPPSEGHRCESTPTLGCLHPKQFTHQTYK